uniref:SPRY domain-containing protein n=1 Tax=Meloidogyne hapla TaxID=6305 RepID=A0A1I8BIG6_MELHA
MEVDISSDSDFELIQIDDVTNIENNFTNFQTDFNELKNEDILIEDDNSLDNKINICYIQIKNKWKYIEHDFECCKNYCINTNKPYGVCVEGNGFINLINKEIIKYINCEEGKAPPLHLKCKYEIGFDICRERENIFYTIEEDGKEYKLPETFTWNNEDIFGCGLVYPPNKKMSEEFPYIFFTQNGKHIGKGILLKDNFEYFHPYIALDVSSLVETNFGNDLKERPFCYEITKHSVLKEFYED